MGPFPSRGLAYFSNMKQSPFRHTVLYDGHCPICLRSVRELERLDQNGALAFLPAQDDAVTSRFPSLSREALERSLHLVGPDGEVWEGADAVEVLLNLLPSVRWAAWVFHVPLVRPLARRIYRWIASNRYHLTCGAHCRHTEGSHPRK